MQKLKANKWEFLWRDREREKSAQEMEHSSRCWYNLCQMECSACKLASRVSSHFRWWLFHFSLAFQTVMPYLFIVCSLFGLPFQYPSPHCMTIKSERDTDAFKHTHTHTRSHKNLFFCRHRCCWSGHKSRKIKKREHKSQKLSQIHNGKCFYFYLLETHTQTHLHIFQHSPEVERRGAASGRPGE